MQIDAQEFLPLVENAGKICFFDIEASGLKADYNSVLCASITPWHGKSKTFECVRPGDDKQLVRELRDELENYLVWVGYYSKGFDIPMIRSRLLHFNMNDIDKRYHIDMYFTLKANVLTARRSQAHLLEWLELEHKKMTLSPQVWNDVLAHPEKTMRTLRQRCESDTQGLMDLYDRTKHLIREIKKG